MLLISFVTPNLTNIFPEYLSLLRHLIHLLSRNLHRNVEVVRMHNLFIARIRVHKLAHKWSFWLGAFLLDLPLGHGALWRRAHWKIRVWVVINLLNRTAIVILEVVRILWH